MSIFIPVTLTRTLPLGTFDAVCQLLRQMAELPGSLLLGEEAIAKAEIAVQLPQRFKIFISERFSALLWVQEVQRAETLTVSNTLLNVGLTFVPEAIASFGCHLYNIHTAMEPQVPAPIDIQNLKRVSETIKSNDANIQSEFTLQLLEIMASERYVNYSVCSPEKSGEDTCNPQLEQERLLHQVTTQIRQSLELPVILSTAVKELQQFLQVDRLLIYQFQQSQNPIGNIEQQLNHQQNFNGAEKIFGRVTYEALGNTKVTSVLNLTEGLDCFPYVPNYQEKYRKGIAKCVNDIETTYRSHSCFLEFMRAYQVRAKLVVPIMVQEKLWGLLIAHQCFEVREWEESKKMFMRQIAEHLAIAIYQAEIYAELQQQKYSLEQRVIERTQELQDALVAAQSASLAKSEFLATMSHELRTPLTCVIGISATLLRWFCHQESSKILPISKQKSYLQIIHDSGKHLLELIEDILDLSQVEAGNKVLKISEFSLDQLIYMTVRAIKEQATAKEIAVSIEDRIEPGCDRVAADHRRIKQILFNLLTNAVKFTPKGGKITFRSWIENETNISGLPQDSIKLVGNVAIFEVEDTGIGIAEEQQPFIFQKFKQLDSPYRREYSGIGLGLALTKQLVEMLGGVIKFKSTIGIGSVFTVYIPIQQIKKDEAVTRKDEKADSLFISQSSSLQGCLVVIEENEEIAAIICDILTAAGLQVVWMVEGSTAVEQIKLFEPIAVIVDMQLTGIDGYEIIHQLRNFNARYSQSIKILALTSKSKLSNKKAAIEAGADDYLSKPVQPDELLYKITNLLMASC
ncbi:hybrid sensor histidine kinase/response regulator [Oscillatoriales cyanobacterium USR001]|nr:hybrid sensor histidine kinase/response regulator [Oscillatoriales cyanobacterium USR001]